MKIVYKRLDELKEDQGNPRKIARYQLECLKESLRKWGFRSPINITKDGTIIGGHQRVRAARELGWREPIPCKVDDDLSVREAQKLNLTLNNITGQNDSEKMRIRLNEIKLEKDEIKSVGFDHVEIEKFSFDKEKDQPEIEFVQELLEKHTYVVLVFDNEVDWLNFVSLYPLPRVKSMRGKYETTATARVISGPDFINHILGQKWQEQKTKT